MKIKGLGLALMLVGPIALALLGGHAEAAKYLGVGCVLSLLLGLLARPVAGFALLLPFVYVAAALTARATDGVVALIVALAAAVGAAGSLGLQRGLVALLGAALLGSFEPAAAGDALRRAGFMLGGIVYGFLIVTTVLRKVSVSGRAVRPQATVGYAVLLAVLALFAWYAARMAGLAHAWWLPLAVVVVSEPTAPRSAWHSLVRTAGVLCATLLLVGLAATVESPALQGVSLGILLLAAIWQGHSHPTLLALLLTPVLVLLANIHAPQALDWSLPTLLVACLPVFAASCLGHFAFWTLRADAGRVAA